MSICVLPYHNNSNPPANVTHNIQRGFLFWQKSLNITNNMEFMQLFGQILYIIPILIFMK